MSEQTRSVDQSGVEREQAKDKKQAGPYIGFVDKLTEFEIIGWVYNETAPEQATRLSLVIDDQMIETLTADLSRPDVQRHGHKHANVGFRIRIPERYRDGIQHRVSFLDANGKSLALKDSTSGSPKLAWTFTPTPTVKSASASQSHSLVVHVDSATFFGITGWAYSERHLREPTLLSIWIDDKHITDVRCDRPRADVKASGHPTELVGFQVPIPPQYFDDEVHIIQFRGVHGEAVKLPGGDTRCKFKLSPVGYLGRLEGLQDGAIRGWALRQDMISGRKDGGLQVLLSFGGQPIAQLTANEFRADVAETLGADPNCGFAFVPPRDLFAGKTLDIRCTILHADKELDNSPCRIAFADAGISSKLQDLLNSAEELFADLWSLRSQIRKLIPGEEFNIPRYDAWAQAYNQRILISPPKLATDSSSAPLVSIICPVYRPRLADFAAAVESVVAQTYQNWELVIVDDASNSTDLTKCIKNFSIKDHRIRFISRRKNGGISAATNAGLAVAKGKYVAFFDHDDLLVVKALELMVHAALRTGAKVLYCDEDKIDDSRRLSEVNLKPDWNYRLLLSQNYICHLLFVERKHLAKVGKLRSKYDGAQDHDLILRLAEITPPEQIYHVPEVLYHWRKTPSSTAAAGKNKDYAAAAGARAVSDHLSRRGIRASVTSPVGVTRYNIRWVLTHYPTVTIIIPYREHIDMTRACVRAIRTNTEYPEYDIILVDNWSTSTASSEFAREMSSFAGVRLIRIEEPFNFSRLNNIAARQAKGQYLLFLNNDVLIEQTDWLNQMVGEAIADARVAVVGNKLLYPNGLVQHGGIILGVGGIADHAHRGLPGDAPGYMSRATSAQDLSAVTAACMLCRRDVFEEVGGFDEQALAVAFNDVDLCLKIRAAGYRIVWTPASTGRHHESLSRGTDFRPEHQTRFFLENGVMQDRWRDVIDRDPHYNPHFSRRGGIFQDLSDPRPDPVEEEMTTKGPTPTTVAEANKGMNGRLPSHLPQARAALAGRTKPLRLTAHGHSTIQVG
ncbi:MAG TPA: glycosyltransferase family 2 protein [Acetobacteraceae bacterium]|nr:glycosyltransferase family 2 protein [Acetobacteraceae bacterium]